MPILGTGPFFGQAHSWDMPLGQAHSWDRPILWTCPLLGQALQNAWAKPAAAIPQPGLFPEDSLFGWGRKHARPSHVAEC